MAAGFLVLGVAGLVGLVLGPASLGAGDVLAALLSRLPWIDLDHGLSTRQVAILWELRTPRVVLGGLVGGTLAIAGASYQGAFRNPLADPYLLGAAAGAGLGATLAIAYGGNDSAALLPLAAFVGAVGGVAAAYALATTVGGARSSATLLLAGVAVASFLTAAQTFVQQRHADSLRQVYGWILGRLATAGWAEVGTALPYVAGAVAVILLHRRLLDLLQVGDDEVRALGAHPERIRLVVLAAATLGTAAVVSVSGLIGFVGIIVPHAVRLVAGTGHRLLLPLSFLVGAAFLILCDVGARTVLAPAELPIGVVTAAVGAPCFALVLASVRGAR